MGAGASKKPGSAYLAPSEEAYNQSHFLKKATNIEARRLQILLSSIGKTTYHEKVLACIKVEFLSTDNLTTHENGHQTLPVADCHQIVTEALVECSVPPEAHQPLMERIVNKLPLAFGIVDVDDLMYIVGQQMCRYNSYLRARSKFDDLDKDKSGFLDGPELNQVVDWMLKMIEENGVELSADEEEVRRMMLERIDADKVTFTCSFPRSYPPTPVPAFAPGFFCRCSFCHVLHSNHARLYPPPTHPSRRTSGCPSRSSSCCSRRSSARA